MTSDNTSPSLLDNLRGAGEAWLNAGSSLGAVVSSFAANLREDRAAGEPTGAHAFTSADQQPQDSVVTQLRAAVDNARGAFNRADNDRDFRAAASSFAADAGSILRDVAGSVSRAGDATLESGEAEQAKAAFGSAVGEVRDTFEQAVSGVRNRAEESDIDAEGIVADLRERLDGLIATLSAQLDNRGAATEPAAARETEPDIIDGDIVADGEGRNGTTTA